MGHYFSSLEETSGYNRWCAQKIECLFEVYVPPFFLASVLFGIVCSIYYLARWGGWLQVKKSVRHFTFYPFMLDLHNETDVKLAIKIRDEKLHEETMSILERELREAELAAAAAQAASEMFETDDQYTNFEGQYGGKENYNAF